MPLLTPDRIDDLVRETLNQFEKGKWVDISLQYQKYCSQKLITEKKVIKRGGTQIQHEVQTGTSDSARNSDLYDPDVTNVDDYMNSVTCPWRKQTVNWIYDIDEAMFQSDLETIVSVLQVREHAAYNAMAELNEENLWTAPTGPNDNRPFGIPYWLQKSQASANGDFVGGNPSGFPGGAGNIDSAANPTWRNYAFTYESVSKDDLFLKLRRSLRRTEFEPVHPHPEVGFRASSYEIMTVESVLEECEVLLESRNDNLGNDVAKYMNQVVVANCPMMWVPYLTANDDTNPLYGINWNTFAPFLLKGRDMYRHPPKEAARQHSVREVHIDNWMNYICTNRRKNFVGVLAA